MIKAIVSRIVAGLAVLILWGIGAQAGDLTPQQIYERAAPAVVMVVGRSEQGQKGSGGTGSIIRRDGLVLTNAHVVVEEATGRPYPRLFVYLKPARVTGNYKNDLAKRVKAGVLAFSQPLDLALLKLEEAPVPLPVLELGDPDRIRIGDRVAAIGHPEQGGLWTLTTGVVSAEFEDFRGTTGKHVFQTETGLNRGNSGGPLLDGQTYLVGVNTAIARLAADGMPITSINFAIKSSVARTWLREQGVLVEYATVPPEPSGPRASAAASTSGEPEGGLSQLPEAPATKPPKAPQPPGSTAQEPQPPAFQPPQMHTPPRPYNLDGLLTDLRRVEAEMEDMLKEMRERTRPRK